MRILIADDNELIRRGIRGLLKREPTWQICGEAADGDEALQAVKELRPDLVLLDLNMPLSAGFETARAIRKESLNVKLLILSHNDAEQLLPSARQAGADGCIDKAYLASELVAAVKNL